MVAELEKNILILFEVGNCWHTFPNLLFSFCYPATLISCSIVFIIFLVALQSWFEFWWFHQLCSSFTCYLCFWLLQDCNTYGYVFWSALLWCLRMSFILFLQLLRRHRRIHVNSGTLDPEEVYNLVARLWRKLEIFRKLIWNFLSIHLNHKWP